MKHLGLLAGLVICLSVTATASAVVIESWDFEPPTFATGPVSGQNGWTGTGDIQTGQYLWGGGIGPKHWQGYGTSWWSDENGLQCTDGFPYTDLSDMGNGIEGSYFSSDVSVQQGAIDAGAATSTLVTLMIDWNDEGWVYDYDGGFSTNANSGASRRVQFYLVNNGTTSLRVRNYYATGRVDQAWVYGTWNKRAGNDITMEILWTQNGVYGIVDGTVSAVSLYAGNKPDAAYFSFKQINALGGLSGEGYRPDFDNIVVNSVPEPMTLILLGGGLLFGGLAYRKRS